jgi:hypothetical protein
VQPEGALPEKRKKHETEDLPWPYSAIGWHREDDMVILLQILAGGLLVLGSGLVFYALLAMERQPRPQARPAPRHATSERDLPRAA